MSKYLLKGLAIEIKKFISLNIKEGDRMKQKKFLAFIVLVLASAVALVYVFWPREMITRMPSTITEKPEYLFQITGNDNNSLKEPMGITVGADQKIYIADTGNQKIKVFSSNGDFKFAFGKKGQKENEFGYPYGIVYLKNGHLLISDTINQNVREFSGAGKYIKTWINKNQNIKPGAMYQDSNGKVYISDLKNHQVVVVSNNGKMQKRINSKPEGLLFPQGLAVDKKGLIWVADSGHARIKQIDSNGLLKNIIWGTDESRPFNMVRGVAVDNLGRIVVTDTLANSVTFFSENREYLFDLKGYFTYPMGVYVSDDGRIFIINRGSSVIQVWGYKK